MAEVEYNYIVDGMKPFVLKIDNGIVVAADPTSKVGQKMVGMSKGAVKAICKRWFRPRRVFYHLKSIEFIQGRSWCRKL